MLSRIELKSFLAGVFGCFLAVSFLGAQATQTPEMKSGHSPGRFRLEVTATATTVDAFVIDTATGEVWQKGVNVGATHNGFFKSKIHAEANEK